MEINNLQNYGKHFVILYDPTQIFYTGFFLIQFPFILVLENCHVSTYQYTRK